MGKKFIAFMAALVVLGSFAYGFYLYKKSSLVGDIKKEIEESLKNGGNIVTKEIEIPSNKVSLSPWKLISGGALNISAGDILITLAAKGSEGKLAIGKIFLKYPAIQKKPIEICRIENAKASLTTPDAIIKGSIKNTNFSPCIKLNQKPHPLKGIFRDIGLEVSQRSDPSIVFMNATCKTLTYSQDGYLDRAPTLSVNTDFAEYVETLKTWYKKNARVGKPLWRISTDLSNVSFFAKDSASNEEVSFSLDKSSFNMSLDTSNRQYLDIKMKYDLNNLKASNRELAISWQLMGLHPDLIFPLTVITSLNIEDIPSELLAAFLFFIHSTGEREFGQEYADQVLPAIFASLARATNPFNINIHVQVSSGASGTLKLNGKANLGSVNARGTIHLKSIDVIFNKLSKTVRSSFEKILSEKLTCDSSYKECTGSFLVRNGKTTFIQQW